MLLSHPLIALSVVLTLRFAWQSELVAAEVFEPDLGEEEEEEEWSIRSVAGTNCLIGEAVLSREAEAAEELAGQSGLSHRATAENKVEKLNIMLNFHKS